MKKYQCGKTFGDGLAVPDAKIYQVEELSLMRGSIMPKHFQRCDEITYVISGKAIMHSDDTCKEITAGQTHFIRQGCTHEIEVLPEEDFRYICIGYTAEDTALLKDFHACTANKNHFILPGDSTVRRLCALLVDECYHWDNHSESLVSCYLSQILVAVYRLAVGKAAASKDSESIPAGQTVYQVLRYIDKEFINIEHARDVSQNLAYSEYYLSHLFKEFVGISPWNYVISKRINHFNSLVLKSYSIEEAFTA